MINYTIANRNESHRRTDRLTRSQKILEHWDGIMTAREIGIKMGYSDLNAVKPRISEMVRCGILREAGKKYDKLTERNVTAYEVAPQDSE
jgi:hypothetical protein